MRGICALLLIAASLLLTAGCGGGGDEAGGEALGSAVRRKAEACLRHPVKPGPVDRRGEPIRRGQQPLHLTLDGQPDAEDAGILIAAKRNYFAAAGIHLEITAPVIPRNIPGYVSDGASDLGILPQPQVTIANSEGMPLVAIGSMVRRPTMALTWLQGTGIEDIDDLEGKTIAVNGLSFEEDVLESALRQVGLGLEDVKLRQLGYELLPALVGGRVDAVLGVSRNSEGIELERCGLEPTAVPLRELGVPPYEELDIVVRRDRFARDPERFRAFIKALVRGTAAAVANPGEAAEAISYYRVLLNSGRPQDPALVREKVEATLPLLSRSGTVSPERADRFAAWMRREGLL